MFALPALQQALVLTAKYGSYVLRTVPVPKPGHGELLIKIHAVALNSIDLKVQGSGAFVQNYPVVLGMDISGTVEQLGEGVEDFALGDRVFTEGYYERSHGGFQQYTLAKADVVGKVPASISFEQASTIPVGLLTAVLGLYVPHLPPGLNFGSAGLCAPWEEGGRGKYTDQPILILGASGSVGQYVVQVAKLSGFSPIIATASAHNFALVHALGATYVLDRHLSPPELRTAVHALVSTPLELIFDAVGFPETQQAGYDLLAPDGCLLLVLPPRLDVRPEDGKRVVKVLANGHEPKENREAAARTYRALPALLEEGAIKPNPVEIVPGGLGGIPRGLKKFTDGSVSGVKLVVRPFDTD